jgi:CRISPR/Cas system CSM-associated protein Csm3 (group 7 of RAMP superfamily)
MDNPADVLNWLTYENPVPKTVHTYADSLPNISQPLDDVARKAFTIRASFQLSSSLLIRSASGEGSSADMVHLRSWRDGQEQPVLSGTSLAGALRARAFRIANTLKGEDKARELVDGMFGKRIKSSKDIPTGSRVIVRETSIESCISDRVQNRVKIDRFTGGAYPQALFSQQPVFAKASGEPQLTVHLDLLKTPNAENFEAEVGLLLLLLKDLWTGDLPLGGESSVGRGRLQGQTANLFFDSTTWEITRGDEGKLIFNGNGSVTELENYVKALQEVS